MNIVKRLKKLQKKFRNTGDPHKYGEEINTLEEAIDTIEMQDRTIEKLQKDNQVDLFNWID